ncbi:hypothetical protein PHLCEN_2v2217 [Hermanssonia centrifuga]|uniref:Uncharacterized protein n=1 Tax=Hermanssonia centrifuga TaxID=98765 RepID=A0A2R6RPQ5_9APHY|nr:hypothetical protein PHLCEN_2v2217 [Hermanssonia centrifuga]
MLNNSHFIPQPPALPSVPQQQGQPPHMALLSGHGNQTPAMNLLGGSGQPNMVPNPNYQLQLQQAAAQRRGHNHPPGHAPPQGMNPGAIAGPPNINGIGHPQMSNMNFQSQMMPNGQIRRVPSQPLGMNQAGNHLGGMGGMHPGPQMLSGMGGMPALNANQQAHFRNQQQQQQIRMQMQAQSQHQLSGGPGNMPSDLAMVNRQPHPSGNVGFAQHAGRSSSAQHMVPGLSQPQLPQSHPPNMQQPSFQNPLTLQHQHQQQPSQQQQQQHQQSQQTLGMSPHPPHQLSGGVLPANMSNPNPGQQAAAMNRARMTPVQDQMFMNFQNPQMTPNMTPRVQANSGGFQLSSSSTPPNQISDGSQSGPGGMGTPGPTALMATPAQAFEQMNQGGENFNRFNMHPPQNVPPPRPSSQQQRHPSTYQIHQPLQHLQQPPMSLHRSPRQPDRPIQQTPVQRPPSQPQTAQRQSPQQAGPSRTPRPPQASLPGQTALGTRLPTVPSQSMHGPPAKPPTPSVQGPSLAPRPPPGPSAPVGVGHPSGNGPPPPPGPSTASEAMPVPQHPPQLPYVNIQQNQAQLVISPF